MAAFENQTDQPKLIIIRGNSGSGKSTVARALRERMGYGTTLIEQDYVRRIVLREKDRPGQPNIELIDMMTRFALAKGYHVILEGILPKKHYGDMLYALVDDYARDAYIYYFDISFEETLRRHQTKPNKNDFGEAEMRQWYLPQDMLGVEGESIVTETVRPEQIINGILGDLLTNNHL